VRFRRLLSRPRRRLHTVSAAGIALATALALSACANSAAEGSWMTVPNAKASPSTGASAAPPSTGTVNWADCKSAIEKAIGTSLSGVGVACGSVSVPRDWSEPQGPKLTLAMVRIRRDDQKNRIGSLLVNPGGPGASGISLAAQTPLFLPADLLTRFDIIGFDPRGVGSSEPINCIPDASKDALTAADPNPATQAGFDAEVGLWRTAVAPCGQKYGQALTDFSTEQTARDMDAIRVAVGDQKLSYLGYSYGTLLGAVYAQLFPTRIRSVVLDGAVDPKLDGVQLSEGQAAGFEKAFDDLAADCRRQGAGCPIGPDARATLNRVLLKVSAKPVLGRGLETREATSGHVLNAVTASLYTKAGWSQVEKAIAAIDTGDPTGIFTLSDQFAERLSDGHYTNQTDAFIAIGCTDERHPPTIEQVRAYQLDWRKKYPLFGGPLAMTLISCTVWPGGHDPFPVGPAVGAPPIVVVGTTGDPATPYANTAKLAGLLGTKSIVTWEGEGHTAYPQTSCVRQNVNRYLIDLVPPAAGLTCPPN
jgi:pimeloyl-ACP methyl ester carboxylesterase